MKKRTGKAGPRNSHPDEQFEECLKSELLGINNLKLRRHVEQTARLDYYGSAYYRKFYGDPHVARDCSDLEEAHGYLRQLVPGEAQDMGGDICDKYLEDHPKRSHWFRAVN
ncbi:MAG: hypothetical protein WC641_04725 [Patescibacteria group bacterium]